MHETRAERSASQTVGERFRYKGMLGSNHAPYSKPDERG